MEKLDVPAKYPLSSGRPSSPAILHGRESAKSPIDVVIGRDAEARWADIHRRQELRDKVRAEGGEVGLTATGRNEFEPISQEQKSKRTEATKQVEREGYKAEYDGTDGEIVR